MIKKVFRQGLAAVLLGTAALTPSLASELRGIGLSSAADSAQLTLDLTDGSAHKVFTLEHPDRIVIDLPHTERMHGVRAPAPAGIVTAVRFGSQPHGTLRIVIELQKALPVHSAWGLGAERRELTVTVGEPMVAVAQAATSKSVRAVHAPGDGDRDIIVAVDAGHGGVDPGAIGHGGTREKDVTLAIARALAERINSEPGMRAVLTRNRDEFVELWDRIARARAAHADLFVSVHADSIADRSVTGASVYVLSVHGASSEAARVLADRENSADLMGGIPIDSNNPLGAVLVDAAQDQIIGMSASAAERVMVALEGVGEIRKAQVQRAGFVVLKSPVIPSMLVETAYISNPSEERRLRSLEQQARLAEAIAGGVRGYFGQYPPDGTRFKQERRSTLASASEAAGGTP
ncbi:MAG TPA: N-acetylmuramoyl-L-alanine amidase [Steroidobacteraceae bacterium]|jgi:N-acetylmuramoyl-L-alanine amidase|nr:N-acetylmuramoyl-L-alanine amidase [Steroidobacteraceae bacterium]